MEPDTLLAAWQHGVPLRDAWFTCAEAQEQRLFIALESEGLHLEQAQLLKDELVGRLYAGQLKAFGVENKSDSRPIKIPGHYFLKTAKIDWNKDSVAALGKEFHNVRVHVEWEPAEIELEDPGPVDLELEPALHLLPNRPSSSKPRGRPSKTSEIEQAIDILLRQGVDLVALPRPKAYKAIRKCAVVDLKANTQIGFSDPVIQRALFDRFGKRR